MSRLRLILILIVSLCSTQALTQTSFISNDGNFVSTQESDSLHIRSTKTDWRLAIFEGRFIGVNSPFSEDSKYLEYKNKRGDSVFILGIGTNEKKFLSNVGSIKTFDYWIAYQLKTAPGELVLSNINNHSQHIFRDVVDYDYVGNGSTLLLKIETSNISSIMLVDLKTGNSQAIWSSNSSVVDKYALNTLGTRFAFLIHEKTNETDDYSIWYYKEGMNKAEKIGLDTFLQNNPNLNVSNTTFEYSSNGEEVIFSLKQKRKDSIQSGLSSVDLWSYTDEVLQSEQQIRNKNKEYSREYIATFYLPEKKIMRLQYENEVLLGTPTWGAFNDHLQINNDYVLVCRFKGRVYSTGMPQEYVLAEYDWNRADQTNVYLKSCRDGSEVMLKQNIKPTSEYFPYYIFSPDGKYVIFFDSDKGNYCSYEIATGFTRNLTKGMPNHFISGNLNDTESGYYFKPNKIFTWVGNFNFLTSDKYNDIWELDITKENYPINITAGYAKKNNLVFYVDESHEFLPDGDRLILLAFNKTNFQEGYYSVSLKNPDIRQLTGMGDYSYNLGFPQKAKYTNDYIFGRESAKDPRETYYTRDFKKILAVSDNPLQEMAKVDKREIFWKTFNGSRQNGILYLPANFNSKRKYPLLITYYENKAYEVANRCECFMGVMDSDQGGAEIEAISYYLKNDYLVFIPDIQYKLGGTGQGAYNSVVSAAQYLSQKPFVDAKKMGIAGHSFGGYETNYILTHSNIFAAACSSSGPTDLISYSGFDENSPNGYLRSSATESGQFRIGTSLWDRPDLYIANSPIFFADRVTTPFLMMANKNDNTVPYFQGVELFKALRRLGKRSWMLQYDEGEHMLGGKDSKDWGIRMIQFFNHYLKGAPAPVWMTRGIPADLKGVKLGYEYDSTMKTPGPGLLIENDGALTPDQKELLRHKTTVNNDGRIVDIFYHKSKLKSK